MMRSTLFDRIAICAVVLGVSFAACSEDAPPPPAAAAGTGAAAVSGGIAGTGALMAGTGAAPLAGTTATGTAGTVGTMGNPVMGTAGTGVAGVPAAGTGVAGMAAVTAGTGTGAPMAGTGAPAFTPGSPTFSAIYQEIIVGKGCNGGPTCHAGTVAGQLKMTTKMESYTALVGVKAMGVNLVMGTTPNCKDSNLVRVVAGNPDMSLFFKKVNSAMPECGGKMPPSGAMLPPAMLDQIRMWIMNGAKDD